MGHGKSERNAPEDDTPGAPQGQPGTGSSAHPNDSGTPVAPASGAPARTPVSAAIPDQASSAKADVKASTGAGSTASVKTASGTPVAGAADDVKARGSADSSGGQSASPSADQPVGKVPAAPAGDRPARRTPAGSAGDPRTRAIAVMAAATAATGKAADDGTDTETRNAGAERETAAGTADATTVLPVAAAPDQAGARSGDTAQADIDDGGQSGDPLEGFEEEPTKKRHRWRPVLIGAGVLVILGGAYVAGAYALADRVPRGTTVAGIEVGGMTADDARTALSEGLADRSSQAITVIAREVTGSVDPATAGLSFDVDATVDSLTGIDLRPQRMWEHLVGGGEQDPVTTVDEDKLTAALDELSGALTLEPVDGSVVFVDGQPQGVAAVAGWSLDEDGARTTLEEGWLSEALPIELPSDTVAPTISQDEVDRVVRDVASAVVSAPVTVNVADQSAELPTDVLAGAASFSPQGSELVLQMDGAALVEQVVSRTSNLLTSAADASFEFQDGVPVVVAGTSGTTLDPTTLSTAVATAATSTTERTATVELVESDPAQSTEALQALGVNEVVGEYSTPLTSESQRTINITAGAAAINGTLIRSGETFSLTDALGPIDAAHGFVQAGAIVNGEHSDAWGGGLSQLSTTTFNAAFEAGMEDVEHTPHSEWFTRYPAGREATLYTGSIDMKWKNTTPYGVLVQAYVADGQTVVKLWSTHYYDVEIVSGEKTDVVQPTTVYNTSATCSASSAGNPGFSIKVTRTVSLNGAVQTTDNLSWRYKAQNQVICGADPSASSSG